MKAGKYKVSFYVDFVKPCTETKAKLFVAHLVSEMIDSDNFPEVNFELEEEFDLEYNTDEEVDELNF